MKSPDEQVGENIIAEFKKQKILPDSAVEKLKSKLIAGALSSSDWKLAFETARPEKEAGK
jgi:hypothetical protein